MKKIAFGFIAGMVIGLGGSAYSFSAIASNETVRFGYCQIWRMEQWFKK